MSAALVYLVNAVAHAEERLGSREDGTAEWAVGRARTEGAELYAQLHQFGLGVSELEALISRSITEIDDLVALMQGSRLPPVTSETPLSDEEVVDFAWRCRARWPANARFRAGYATDGSITIVTGPSLPWVRAVDVTPADLTDEPPLRIETSGEYDAASFYWALELSRAATHVVAELNAHLRF